MKSAFVNRFYKPVKRRLRRHLFKPIKLCLKFELAKRYRPLLSMLGKVCFIGVTGSCGKTTTKELIAAILANEGRVLKSNQKINTTPYVIETILSVRPWHDFCVSEVSAPLPGIMGRSAKLFWPHIGVVTSIGRDHYSSYRNLESTAAEKGKLVEALPADGTAILNADDPHVYAMRQRTKARVITYGLSDDAMVRGENVSCDWPQRLSLDVYYAEKQLHVQTQLLGKHWAYAVLAALSAAVAVGIPLERAAEAIETFEPVPGRMSPYISPDGITFIRDDWKAPLWNVPTCMDFMRTAKAERKIIVIGSISDTPKSFYRRYRDVIRQALDEVDKMVFVGQHSRSALRARPHPEDERIIAFDTLYQLNGFLSNYLKAGDLVLLKGSTMADHLQRIVLSQTNDIACWQQNCRKFRFCSDCRLQHSTFVPSDEVQTAVSS